MRPPNSEEAPAPHEDLSKSVATKQADIGHSIEMSESEFWQTRESLRRIADLSRYRHTAPWSVLGVCLARTLAVVPPWVTLPPKIGGKGSLNLFVAIVASSGIGKGASEAVARELVPFDDRDNIPEVPAGSGEGLAHAYVRRATTGPEKGSIIRERNACLFTVPEVDTLTEIGRRQGSTIMSKLRSAYSGEEIGFFYADPAKRLLVGPHQYRLCLTLGVQPKRAAALLSDADGGTPQRFVWLPAKDPAMIRGRGKQRDPIDYVPLREWGGSPREVDVPHVAVNTVLNAAVARHRGTGDALDGHALLTRLKVMVGLAAMDGRTDPDESDWHLAGVIMGKSDATRAAVIAELAAARDAEAAERGHAQGVARDAAAVSAHSTKLRRMQVRVVRKAAKQGGTATQRELLHSFNSQDRESFAEALQALINDGYITTVDKPAEGEALNQSLAVTPHGRVWLEENGGRKS